MPQVKCWNIIATVDREVAHQYGFTDADLGHHCQLHASIGALSQKHAIKLLEVVGYSITIGHFQKYSSDCWGDRMLRQYPAPEVGVWLAHPFGGLCVQIVDAEGRLAVPILERILCAAILYKNEPKPEHPVTNADGLVLCGHRHNNIIAAYFALGKRTATSTSTQGFLTSFNRFVDREEAAQIAFVAKQTRSLKPKLYSEDLY